MSADPPRENPPDKLCGTQDLRDLRRDYRRDELLESEVAADPLEQFGLWFNQARQAGEIEPNAMGRDAPVLGLCSLQLKA